MAVLVTGAAGFIGFHTVEALLARGETVIGLDDLNDYYAVSLKQARLAQLQSRGGAFSFLRADIADAAALNEALGGLEIDRVVHLAAQAGVRYSLENPAAYVRSNMTGHANLVEFARQRGVEHFVYASSSSVYGASKALPFRVEDRADYPLSLYAATKRADELISESYASLFRVPSTGLRFFTVYGPWGRPDMAMWLFTEAIFAGRPIRLFNRGEMRRDFTFVDDIISGVLACLDRPPADDGTAKPGGSTNPHAIYNIGNHRSEALRDVVTLIEQSLGRKAQIELAEMQPGDMLDTFADISAMERDFNFMPRTPISEGIPKFVSWFTDNPQIVSAAGSEAVQ
jgi:UDP-glucuronate 4-epimerase